MTNENTPISASIVLYNEDLKILTKTVNCFLGIPYPKKLYLIDNTNDSRFRDIFNHKSIQYIGNKKNKGFSAGHNQVLPLIKNQSSFHLILNPDVFFKAVIFDKLIQKLKEDVNLSMIAPAVTFPNGNKQYTVRKYPNLLDLFARKFNLLKNRIHNQEYRYLDLTKSFYPDAVHACFMLFKTEDFLKIKGFDERYFLYMEDIDVCKKIDAIGNKKMYYPNVEIKHVLKKGSSRDVKLFFSHINSVFKYFLKWNFKLL